MEVKLCPPTLIEHGGRELLIVWHPEAANALERPMRWGTAFITPHEDRFFLFTEKGDLVIAGLDPEGYTEISRAHLIDRDGGDMRQRPIVWSPAAYADKCVFVRNGSEIACFSLAAE